MGRSFIDKEASWASCRYQTVSDQGLTTLDPVQLIEWRDPDELPNLFLEVDSVRF